MGKFKFCGHWRGETYKDQICYWGAKDIEYHEVSTVNNPADDYAQIMKVTVVTDSDDKKDSKEDTTMAGTNTDSNKTTNADNAKWIIDKQYNDYDIVCDSSEKKSTNDYRDAGLPAKNAIKGPGSVEYGMKWLQGRKIVIDPRRTPNAYKEFTEYEYERDKEGNVISGYPDANNHLIDATRYALERFCNKRGTSA